MLYSFKQCFISWKCNNTSLWFFYLLHIYQFVVSRIPFVFVHKMAFGLSGLALGGIIYSACLCSKVLSGRTCTCCVMFWVPVQTGSNNMPVLMGPRDISWQK